MRKPRPTVAFLRECFVCDGETGKLYWRERPIEHFASEASCATWNKRFPGTVCGAVQGGGYRAMQITFDGVKINCKVHQIIYALETGSWAVDCVDHINGDTLDNRIANLRAATVSENQQNSRIRRNNKLGFKGVSGHGDKYQAKIRVNGRAIHLGTFVTPQDAHSAYLTAAAKHHGHFARAA